MHRDFRYHIECLTHIDDKSHKEMDLCIKELHPKYNVQLTYEQLSAIMGNPNRRIFVALGALEDSDDDSIIGCILCAVVKTLSMTKVMLSDLSVLPIHRNKGVARLLFKKAYDYASYLDADVVELLVKRDNAPAISIYETFDFEKPDYIYMRKILKKWPEKEV